MIVEKEVVDFPDVAVCGLDVVTQQSIQAAQPKRLLPAAFRDQPSGNRNLDGLGMPSLTLRTLARERLLSQRRSAPAQRL